MLVPIVITRPEFVAGEAEIINDLFGLGLPLLHLRKPGAGDADVCRLAGDICPEYRDRVTVHYHHEVAERLGLGGVHLSGVRPCAPAGWRGRVSASCHSLGEVGDRLESCDYVFLSPIYDSVSKSGYMSGFGRDELVSARESGLLCERVMALGGVTPERIGEIGELGFGGFGVLGWLWGDCAREGVLGRFGEIVRNLG